MPTENQQQINPETGEPEVYKGGAWLTDWASLSAHADWVSEDVHYNENAFTDQSAKTLLVDDSGHLFRITNNSHLELLRVITTDGTTTDTVQPALTAFQLIPLNANGIYNVWRTGDNLVIREVGQAATADVAYDETSIAEYSVAWGGTNGGSNASSSSVYVAPDDIITLDHDGDYTFTVLPYQKTVNQEAGTMTGGVFSLKNSDGGNIASLTFPDVRIDQNYINRPYSGSSQTLYRENMIAGTYRLGFISAAGAGGGNRVSYNGYAHVIVRRASLKVGTATDDQYLGWQGNGHEYFAGDKFQAVDPNTGKLHVWEFDVDHVTVGEDFEGEDVTMLGEVGASYPTGTRNQYANGTGNAGIWSGGELSEGHRLSNIGSKVPSAFDPVIAVGTYGSNGAIGLVGWAVDPIDNKPYVTIVDEVTVNTNPSETPAEWKLLGLPEFTTTAFTITSPNAESGAVTIPASAIPAGKNLIGFSAVCEYTTGQFINTPYTDEQSEPEYFWKTVINLNNNTVNIHSSGTNTRDKPVHIKLEWRG